MTTAELHVLAGETLGARRRFAGRRLRVLEGSLRPGERVETLAFAKGSPLLGGGLLVAATGERLILVTRSHAEALEYGALTSVTDDAAHREMGLISARGVHTLKLSPAPRAFDVAAALRAHVSPDRIHARAGGAEARRAQRALVVTVLCVCLAFGGRVVLGVLWNAWQDRRNAPAGLDELAAGRCLDLRAGVVACNAGEAVFVVLGPRDMRRCPAGSPTIIATLATTDAAKRELSPWCIDVNTPDR